MLRHALRFLTVLSVFVFCGSLYATINDTSDSAVGGVLINAEGMLSQALGRLFAVMENYPQLRANENVMQLQNTLTALEDEIQIARRYYNGTVREYNTRTEVFPASIIARQYGFQKADFFELDNVAEREVPQVSF